MARRRERSGPRRADESARSCHPGESSHEVIGGRFTGSAAYPFCVLRQAQHEARFFRASTNEINLILSLSKDEAAASAAGNIRAMIDFLTASQAGIRVAAPPWRQGGSRL